MNASRWVALLAGAVAVLAIGPSADAQVHRFDMGPEDSPVWPGFELVTAAMTYSPERGFGWVSEGKIVDRRNFQPDDLCRDLVVVERREPLEFRLDVPNGDYQVCVISGDDLTAGGDWNPSFHLMQLVRVVAEGEEAFRVQRDYYGLQDRDYVPGECIWDKYIRDRYLQRVFPVTVRDGVVSRVTFEWMAEGRDDYDYLYTCEQLIAKAEQKGIDEARQAVEAARATLAWIAEQTFTDYDYRGSREAASGLYRDAGCRWAPGDFQKYRWLVAREIMRLNEALE